MTLNQVKALSVPYNVRYPGQEVITVVGYGDAGLHPVVPDNHLNTTVHFSGGGWLWLPDLLRYYDHVPADV